MVNRYLQEGILSEVAASFFLMTSSSEKFATSWEKFVLECSPKRAVQTRASSGQNLQSDMHALISLGHLCSLT